MSNINPRKKKCPWNNEPATFGILEEKISWAKMAILWHVRPNLGKMRFFQKKGSAIFLPLLSPNFMPGFGKILGAVSEINS